MLRSFPNADAAEDAATLGAAAGRGQAASGAVACAASTAMAWTGASAWSVESCAAHGDASGDAKAHREGRGQARGEAIAMGLCGPAPKHPRTQHQSEGGPLWKVWFWRVLLPQHRAMDLLKKSGKYVEEFGDQQVVALFLPVFSSPSRALCAEYWQNATIGWSRNFSTYFWPIFKASWSHAL